MWGIGRRRYGTFVALVSRLRYGTFCRFSWSSSPCRTFVASVGCICYMGPLSLQMVASAKWDLYCFSWLPPLRGTFVASVGHLRYERKLLRGLCCIVKLEIRLPPFQASTFIHFICTLVGARVLEEKQKPQPQTTNHNPNSNQTQPSKTSNLRPTLDIRPTPDVTS